jgi:hypothetical protein
MATAAAVTPAAAVTVVTAAMAVVVATAAVAVVAAAVVGIGEIAAVIATAGNMQQRGSSRCLSVFLLVFSDGIFGEPTLSLIPLMPIYVILLTT